MSKFSRRFTRDNQNLADYIANTDDPQDDELESRSERLRIYALEVRRYSVLLGNQASTWEIYQVATRQSDPKIALILAAADDADGNPQFPNQESIEDILYGIDPPQNIGNNDLLADGVWRVSVAFTASILVGQLSQVEQQFEHANKIWEEATRDLDRIIAIPDSVSQSSGNETSNLENYNSAFFFNPKTVTLDANDTLTSEIYIPSLSGASTTWETVETYTDDIETGQIVADIADKVNQMTLNNQTLNLLASPSLAGPSGTQFVEFYPRMKVSGIQSDVISIRFTYYDDSQGKELDTTPFEWGVRTTNLADYTLNSTIVVIDQNVAVAEAIDPNQQDQTMGHTVLYFRSKGNTPSSHKIKFRINPTDEEIQEITVDKSLPASQRPGDAVLKMIQKLSELQRDTRVLGAITRNDDPSVSQPTSAFRLVAYAVTNPEKFIVLDVLELPDDLEIALGTTMGPATSFSSRPKSVRVETVYSEEFDLAEEQLRSRNKPVGVVKMPRSNLLDQIKDETKIATGYWRDDFE